jgi:phosphohistidine phosphatase
MRLYLVQHGEAQPESVDPQRHLTERGRRDVEKVASFLRPLQLRVGTIWHSGKPRARQTADVLANSLASGAGTVERPGLAPNDPVEPVRDAVTKSQDDLVIVGHLPFFGRLAASLLTGGGTGDAVAFRYGGVVCLERQDDDAGGGWKVAWMIVPDLLPPS